MPLMGWDAFCDAHHRPFMISAKVDGRLPQGRLDSMQHYIRSLSLRGNFAFCQDGKLMRMAFESEREALEVARLLGARKVGRGDEWAGRWAFTLNEATRVKITSAGRKLARQPDHPPSISARSAAADRAEAVPLRTTGRLARKA